MPNDFESERLSHAVEAIKFLRRSQDQLALANGLKSLGNLERQSKQLDSALQRYQEAAGIYRDYRSPLSALLLAHALRHIGDIHQQAARPGPAEPFYRESLEIYRREKGTQPLDFANAIRGMAIVQGELDNVEPAKLLWQEARALYESEQIPAGIEECDQRLAKLNAGTA
jgi:tetratricopeptide (TPR) repeat protein